MRTHTFFEIPSSTDQLLTTFIYLLTSVPGYFWLVLFGILLSLTLLKFEIDDTYSGSSVCVWIRGACEAQELVKLRGVKALRVASYIERLGQPQGVTN